jgi:hypothetical protein
MKQLKMGDILNFAAALNKEGMTVKEIAELPIYLGDDDELNGIHCAWEVSYINADKKDGDTEYVLEMINERSGNYKLEKGKAILIS